MLRARALVTGGRGFIGSYLVRRLCALGWTVIVPVRPAKDCAQPEGQPPTPQDGDATVDRDTEDPPSRCQCIPVDLLDDAGVEAMFEAHPVQVVFHLAADTRVERSLDLVPPMLDLHSRAAGVLLSAALRPRPGRPPLERFVWVGTCEEYGDGPAPFLETQAPAPVSPYGASRLAGTLMAQMLGRTMGHPVVCLRPFLTYGPGQQASRFVAQAMQRALRGQPLPMTPGQQTRDLVYVEDVVEGLLKAAITPDLPGGALINLASGQEVTLLSLARQIYALADADPALISAGSLPYRPGETLHFVGSTERARTLLGWHTSTSLEDGLTRTLNWERSRLGALRNSTWPLEKHYVRV